jgi:hypothetical protein
MISNDHRLATAVFGVVMALGGQAFAQGTTCAVSAERGQQLQSDGKLIAAREQYLVCGRPDCPAVVKRDCTGWLESVEKSLPTVVFAARAGGQDLVDVRVRVDGELIATALDGRAVFVDPGAHILALEVGDKRVQQRVVVAEGEKNRKVTVTFPDEAPVSREHEHATAPSRPVPVATYVLGAVALVAFGGFVAFGVSGRSQLDDLHACAGSCSPWDVSALRRDMVLTDVSLGVGVVAAALATWLFITRPPGTVAAAR